MSLINDALKKAQRERTGEPQVVAPMPGGGPRPAPSDPGRPAAFRLQVMLIGGGAVLGLVIAAGALLFSRRESPAETRPSSAVASDPVAKASEPATLEAPKSPAPSSAIETKAPASEPSVVASATSTRPPAAEPPLLTVKTTPPEPAVATVATAPSGPSAPPPATTKFVDAVEALRVMGIRASGSESKVLMNDRVFRIGDVVNHDLGVKLTGVTANSLTFVDATGATYTRYF